MSLLDIYNIFNAGSTLVRGGQRLHIFQGLRPVWQTVRRKGFRLQVISWLTSALI